MFRGFVLAQYDFPVELDSVRIFKGQVAHEHSVERDPAGPNVHINPVVALACHHLGRRVAWRATGSYQSLARLVLIGKTEVHNFDYFLVCVQQQVFWFEVSVSDSALV